MAETSGKAVQVKLVLLGEAAVGKSSLVCRFVQNDFNENTSPTIGAAFSTQKCRLDNRTVKFEIWDTAGQERFHSLAPMYYRNAQAAVVVYDITKATSLEKAKSWVKELQRQASPNIVIALVGNKLDLVAEADASSGSAIPKAKATKTQSSAVGETDAAEGEEAEAAKDGEPETGSDSTSVTEDAEAADVEVEAEDSDNPRQISTAEASTYAAEAKLLFTEASAKTGQGIQEIFETIAKAIPIDTPPAAGAAGAAGVTGQRSEGQGGRARAREGVDLGEQQAKKGGCC